MRSTMSGLPWAGRIPRQVTAGSLGVGVMDAVTPMTMGIGVVAAIPIREAPVPQGLA